MNFGIILMTNDGYRLDGEGCQLQKPLIPLLGESLIEHLVRILKTVGSRNVYIVADKQADAKRDRILRKLKACGSIHIIKRDITCALEGVNELLRAFPYLKELCVVAADMVFHEKELRGLIREFSGNRSADAFIGVSSFMNNDSPLYVQVGAERQVLGMSEERQPYYAYVSVGMYCLREKALTTVKEAMKRGIKKMRNYQQLLLAQQIPVKAYPMSHIVHINCVRDIRIAEIFLDRLKRAEGMSTGQ